MLEQSMKDQVKSVFQGLKSTYVFKVEVDPLHESREQLLALLNDVASCSENVSCEVSDGDGLSFYIEKNGESSSVVFRAVPTGHEFTSLLLAILNMDGIGKNLPDEMVASKIKALKGRIHLKSFISLSCTNCPDVVQALNLLAFTNPTITHEIIDGAINQQEADLYTVRAVPTVFANGKQLHVGRASLGELLAKLENIVGAHDLADVAGEKKYDVVIVGGGPAGISAAIYSARKGFSVALVAQTVGGQVTETVAIENVISVVATTGSELTANLKKHVEEYPVDVLENRRVEKVEILGGMKYVKTSIGETLIAPALIVATGASWRKLNVAGESEYIGSGVAFCTHCDGPFYKGKKVAVVGGGNSGLEAAIDLSSIATHVTVLEFMDSLKGDKVLQDKIARLPNVRVLTGVAVKSIEGNGKNVTGLVFEHRKNGQTQQINVDGVFVQIGLTANSAVLADIVALSPAGEIIVDSHCRTNVAGIYAAGDVTVVPYKQIVVAIGEGAKAALSAFDDSIKGVLIDAADEHERSFVV